MSNIKIKSEDDCIGFVDDPRECRGFLCLGYSRGGYSYIPDGLFSSWQNAPTQSGNFYIGKFSSIGIDSIIKFDNENEGIKIGRYTTIGLRVKFLPGGNHETQCISTCQFSAFSTIENPPAIETDDIVIKNDVWIGDEAMILGGSIIENGCIIGARAMLPKNFKTEPYGVYAGNPARLIKFRFPENIVNKLLALEWWNKSFEWLKENADYFMSPVTEELLRAMHG